MIFIPSGKQKKQKSLSELGDSKADKTNLASSGTNQHLNNKAGIYGPKYKSLSFTSCDSRAILQTAGATSCKGA